MRLRISTLMLVLAAVTAGCEDDLPKPTLIADMRVLGARQEVVGAESRSTPRPGETARLTWAMAYPDVAAKDDALASLFIVCTAPTRYTGTPVCQELVDVATGRSTGLGFSFGGLPTGCDVKPNSTQTVSGIRLQCVTGTPIVDVPIAKSIKTQRLVQGVICRNGTPRFDLSSPTGASCSQKPNTKEEDFESVTVYGTVDVATAQDDENGNPDLKLAMLSVRTSESSRARTWTTTPADALPKLERDCASSDAVLPTNGYPEVILIDYPKQPSSEGQEDLVFSSYATFGELSRRFTVIEGDTSLQVDAPDLTWELSEEERTELIGSPKLIRFFFTVLDGRGGFDITTRELCVNRL
jgi:hypothetical protein